MSNKLAIYVKAKAKDDTLFNLAPASISGKIKTFAIKTGVDIHTHSLRVYVVSKSGTKWAFEVTDTLEATALSPGRKLNLPRFRDQGARFISTSLNQTLFR